MSSPDWCAHRERRVSERQKLRLACLLQEGDRRGSVLKLYTRDISCCGAFFYFTDRFPSGAPVEMDLLLPFGSPGQSLIKTKGRVIRSDRRGIAVRFDSEIRVLQAV